MSKNISDLRVTQADTVLNALYEAYEVLGFCRSDYPSDSPENREVEALCEKWGYGAVMAAASGLWRRKTEQDPILKGAELTSGPCRITVEKTRRMITAAINELEARQ